MISLFEWRFVMQNLQCFCFTICSCITLLLSVLSSRSVLSSSSLSVTTCIQIYRSKSKHIFSMRGTSFRKRFFFCLWLDIPITECKSFKLLGIFKSSYVLNNLFFRPLSFSLKGTHTRLFILTTPKNPQQTHDTC